MSPPTDTIARKWRRLKKRCSFSGSDRAERLVRSKSFTEPEVLTGVHRNSVSVDQNERYAEIGNPQDNRLLIEETRTVRTMTEKEKYMTVGSKDMPKFQGLRDRISQWNSELKKRRASSENLASLQQAKMDSMKSTNGNSNNEDNSMFVVASPKHGYVKNAVVISSNAKETPTNVMESSQVLKSTTPTSNRMISHQYQHRISPRNSTPVKSKDGGDTPQQHSPLADSLAWSSPSPSPPASEDSGDFGGSHHNQRNSTEVNTCHTSSYTHSNSQQIMFMDQDSGYDGFCPEKSIYSTGSSETSSLLSSDGHDSGLATSSQHNSTNSTNYPSMDYTFPRSRGRPRPSPIYEKHSEYGNREMLRDRNLNTDSSSPKSRGDGMNHYGTVNSSPRAKIAQATVVNLVNKSHLNRNRQQSPPCTPPPPLPPRPALHPVSPNSLPPIPSSGTKPGKYSIQHGAISLPRKRNEFAERARRRGSYHDDQTAAAVAPSSPVVGGNSNGTLSKRGDIRVGSELVLEPISKVRMITIISVS